MPGRWSGETGQCWLASAEMLNEVLSLNLAVDTPGHHWHHWSRNLYYLCSSVDLESGSIARHICIVQICRGIKAMNANTLMNVKQLAEYLQLKPGTVYAWAQKGKLPAIKVGRHWRFRREEIDAWLDANSHGPTNH